MTPPLHGLSTEEVASRVRDGLGNVTDQATTRSIRSIVRANTMTRFNALLLVMFAAIAAVGAFKDSIFIWVVVLNSVVGIVQEIRARRTLDALQLISAPQTRVRRDGVESMVPVVELVVDDLVLISRGDEVPVDAVVVDADGLEVDESLLTGEADTVAKTIGDAMLSGSFAVSGSGLLRATAVGNSSYARRLTVEARQFTLTRSELRDGTDTILRLVSFVVVPVAVLLLWSQRRAGESFPSSVAGTVAGVVAMVPEGLVLLTSVAFAAGVVRLGRHGVLTRELSAIEGLARVDTLCIDKTGTLTVPGMRLVDVVATGTGSLTDEVATILSALSSIDEHPNPSTAAIAATYPRRDGPAPVARVGFSSARKWSGATFAAHGTWVLGAPEFVLTAADHDNTVVLADAAARAANGNRILVLAHTNEVLNGSTLPPRLRGVVLVVLSEELKADVDTTLGFFAQQGVDVKVISGDSPVTVAAVAQRAGLVVHGVFDARSLPDDDANIHDVLEANNAFGRVTPEQKRRIVRNLQANGHTVAMTGDGVNDLLALKDADIGVAMGNGSAATRSVAQFVLVDDDFGSLPRVVAEGRRVIANIERLANLFVTKTVYALLLALATGVGRLPFPFLPRQLSVVGTLTIGIPSFILAFEPGAARAKPGYVGRVLRFALPSGAVAAIATFAAYADARTDHATLAQARTTSTVVLFCVAIWILSLPIRPLNRRRGALLAVIVATFVALILAGPSRRYLELSTPPWFTLATAGPLVLGAWGLLEAGTRIATRRRSDPVPAHQSTHQPKVATDA